MKSLPSTSTFVFLYSRSANATLLRHFHSSSSAPPPRSNPHFRRQQEEEESRSVRVSVWWDFENCHLPAGANVFRVAHSITSAVRASGIKGPVQITGVGDVMQLSRPNQEALLLTGITLTHVPNGGKNSADRSLLVDLMCWVSQNPPPAHLFLISGDRYFATILHRLRMSNYNILLASPENASAVLRSAASIMWQWNALAKGDYSTGKHFSQPPDGPYGSWYGHYKVPLENPFAIIEQPTSSRPEEVSKSNQELKPRVVPKAVMEQIQQIMNSYPKGISIMDLRSELSSSNLSIDQYGFKKFSRFLLSMPQILRLKSRPDGQLYVHSANPKKPEVVELAPDVTVSTGPVPINQEPKSVPTSEVKAKDKLVFKDINEKPLLPTPYDLTITPNDKIENEKPSLPIPVELSVKPIGKVENFNKDKVIQQPLYSVENGNPAPEVGFFGGWRKWLYGTDDVTGCKSFIAVKNSENVESNESNMIPATQNKDDVDQSIDRRKSSTIVQNNGNVMTDKHVSGNDDKVSAVDRADTDKSSADVCFFKRIEAWCMFWSQTPKFENLSEHSSERLDLATVETGKHELFSQESFWKGLEAFLDTRPHGSVLILHSMSREQMAHNLQKHGPVVLRPLNQTDLLHLVDLLISHKRWVEECPSQAYPFKLVLPQKEDSSPSTPPNKSTLRSMFLGKLSESNSETVLDNFGERGNRNLPQDGVSASVSKNSTRPSNKSRNEILSDCQKLVDDIVKEYPQGYNMGLFRKHFLDTYNYPLEIQKLGYQKLVTLLQIMPGVKVESSNIYPAVNVASGVETLAPFSGENLDSRVSSKRDSELPGSLTKDNELDSTWEELGPVASTRSKQNGEFESRKSAKEAIARRVNHDYEALADDFISDSEDETSPIRGSEEQGKHTENEEDSSLLRILGSWYGTKEEKDSKEGSENVEGMVVSLEDESKPSRLYGDSVILKTEAPSVCLSRKQRPLRSYSFVSEKSGNNQEKLIDGILGSLKKSGESRIHG